MLRHLIDIQMYWHFFFLTLSPSWSICVLLRDFKFVYTFYGNIIVRWRFRLDTTDRQRNSYSSTRCRIVTNVTSLKHIKVKCSSDVSMSGTWPVPTEGKTKTTVNLNITSRPIGIRTPISKTEIVCVFAIGEKNRKRSVCRRWGSCKRHYTSQDLCGREASSDGVIVFSAKLCIITNE